MEPEPDSAIVWPPATTLSGVAGWAFGQVKVSPSWVNERARGQARRGQRLGGVTGVAAVQVAGAGLLSSLMPGLLNASDSDAYGTDTCAGWVTVPVRWRRCRWRWR